MAQEILISINVNSGKAEANLGNAKQSVDKLAAAQKRLKEAESATAIEIAKVNIQTKEQIAINNEAAAALLKNTQNGSKQFRTQVGLNNAILQEAGRAASDARFGFNGVANNVGQLASLFGSLINTSDNVLTSLKNLGKSLLGTGGILIAVQLLIAYGDQIYNFFFNASSAADELSKKMKGLLEPISQNRLELLGYTEVLKDNTSSEEARIEALNELAKVVPDAIDDNGNLKVSYQELQAAVEDYIEQLTIRAEIEAIIDLNSEKFSKRRKVRALEAIEDEDERNKAIKKYLDEEIGFFEASGRSRAEQRKFDRLSEEEQNKIRFASLKKRTEAEAQQILDSVVELQKKLKGVRDEDEFGGNKRGLREFEEGLFRIQRLIDRYNEEADKINVRTLDEKLDLEEEYAKREADSKLKNFEEQQAKRIEEYKERVKGAKNAGELIANAELDYQNSIEDAKIKHGEAILAIEDGIITKRILAKDKEAQAIGRIERSIEDKEIDRLRFSIGANEEYFNKKLEQVGKDKENVDAQIANADTLKLSDLEVAELRKQSFALQNQQIDLNLDKEISSIKAKQAINMEYVGFAKGISQLMGTLAGENEALQKAALIVEKGAAIANIVIKTQAANAVTIAQDTASLGATIPITTPLRLRNNISAGISIANILATTIASFRKPSASGGGASAASVTVQAPDFNVVGTSSVDQLAQTVAGQTNEPIKAYVVGKDITNQQEFDRNIVNTAGI
jgi:hypothetical protein